MVFESAEGGWKERLWSFAGDIPTCFQNAGMSLKNGSWQLNKGDNIVRARAALLGSNCDLTHVQAGDDSGRGAKLTVYVGLRGVDVGPGLLADMPFHGMEFNYRSTENDLYQSTRLLRGLPDSFMGADATAATAAKMQPLLLAYHTQLGVFPDKFGNATKPWGFKVANREGAASRQPITGIQQTGTRDPVTGNFVGTTYWQINTPGFNPAVGDKVKISRLKLSGSINLNFTWVVQPDPNTGLAVPNGFVIPFPYVPNQIPISQMKVFPDPGKGIIFAWAYPQGQKLVHFGPVNNVGEGSRRCSSDIITHRRAHKKKKRA